ncbi:hypothetical protein ACIPWY_39585 [Streptomyces sp. NPDC090032]
MVAVQSSFDGREAVVQRVQRDIECHVPLLFGEDSVWVVSFEEIAMGMWS